MNISSPKLRSRSKAKVDSIKQTSSGDEKINFYHLVLGFISKNWLSLLILFFMRTLSAFYSPIGDCDETYNYWEPTHYLIYGNGLQTWEYSPTYALRSQLYAAYHALHIQSLFSQQISNKIKIFYLTRFTFSLFSFFIESLLTYSIEIETKNDLKPSSNFLKSSTLLLFNAFSPGLFFASTSYLPSTTSMYLITLAYSFYILDMHFQHKRLWKLCILFSIVSVVIVWPFSALAILPMALDLMIRSFKNVGGVAHIQTYSIAMTVLIGLVSLVFDTWFYGRVTSSFLNIILYNTSYGNSSSTRTGQNLYGTEPQTYYLRNLLLNFNIALILAFLFILFQIFNGNVYRLFVKNLFTSNINNEKILNSSSFFYRRSIVIICLSTLIFTLVFTLMPHKEERFLYSIYPLICICAGLGLQTLTLKKFFGRFKGLIKFLVFSCYILFGSSRIASILLNYRAPLITQQDLSQYIYESTKTGIHNTEVVHICTGSEWYRYPNSFFMPHNSRLAYIDSGFGGILPQYFNSKSTRVVPKNMNDQNRREPSRFVNFSSENCDYFVALIEDASGEEFSLKPSTSICKRWLTKHRVKYNLEAPKIVSEHRFLDASKSPLLSRVLQIPYLSNRYNRYSSFCAFKFD